MYIMNVHFLFHWLVSFVPFIVSPEALLVDSTIPIFSPQSLFDGARLWLQLFPRIQWAVFVAGTRGCPKRVFHWSAAWPSWQPFWLGVISFQNFRSLNHGLYFCMDSLTSSELLGYVDLTDYYEIWPKCSLVIDAKKDVRLFWYSKYFSFYALSCDEDRQIFNSPTSKQIFSASNRNIEKASHPFVVNHLLIDIVQFVCS